jgi:DNA polymerase-1
VVTALPKSDVESGTRTLSTKPDASFLQRATYVVDASSYIFRAYYAIRAGLTAPDGTPTHATLGFLQMVQSLIDEHHPARLIFVWDRPEKGERHKVFDQYKANRSAPPEDLGIQIDNVKLALSALGYSQIDAPGFEADDCIATLVRKNIQDPIVVVTSDKDLLQLVGQQVLCLDTMKKKWLGVPEALEKFGVEPTQIAYVQALSGDSVDNVPGAPGIGPKTSTELIQFYKGLDAVIDEAQLRFSKGLSVGASKADPLKGKRIESIANNVDLIRVSLKLVSLYDAPIESALKSFDRTAVNTQAVHDLYSRLGFTRLLERVQSEEHAGSESVTVVAAPRDFLTHTVESQQQLSELLVRAEHSSFFVFDTETKSLDSLSKSNLVGLSFAFDLGHGYYAPLDHASTSVNLSWPETRSMLERFFAGLAQKASSLIFHNAKFDLHVLRAHGLEIPKKLVVHDSMLESFVLDPAERHGMDDLSVKYLKGYRPQSFKEVLGDRANFSEVPLVDASFYSAEDSVITGRLFFELQKRLKESSKLYKVYDELDRPLVRVLADIEEAGVSIDARRLKVYSTALHKELTQLEAEARAVLKTSGVILDDEFNMSSPKQIAQVLYEQLKLPILKKGKTGPSTDVSVLEELAEQHPFPEKLLEIRELNKLLSTYVDALPELIRADSGRVHTDFSQTIAATGRLSSTNPNLQNIPIRTERGKKIRESFVAQDGHQLVGIDYSQIEIRVLAELSGDVELSRAFHDGADIHRRTAALMFSKDEAQVSDTERRMAKTINFGIIYGQSAFGLSKQLKIPKHQAQEFIDNYQRTYPGIKRFADSMIEQAHQSGRVETLIGRQRFLPEINSKNFNLRQFAERMAMNTPIQGTAADLMKAAMIRVHDQLQSRGLKSKIILQVHDELLIEAPLNEVSEAQQLAIETMQDPSLFAPFGYRDFKIKMLAESGSGAHWGEL